MVPDIHVSGPSEADPSGSAADAQTPGNQVEPHGVTRSSTGEAGIEASPSSTPSISKKFYPSDAFVLFVCVNCPSDLGDNTSLITPLQIPILGFETHRHRKYLTRAINDADPSVERDWKKETEPLLDGYLNEKRPLHPRRTLDQFSYYMLPSTETRDIDQVIYRWARAQCKVKAEHRPVFMVDQLWLWALHDGCPSLLMIDSLILLIILQAMW